MSIPTPPTAEPVNPGRMPFPRPALPGTGQATPSTAADALARHLTGQGIVGIYTAACDRYALIAVTTGLIVWTNGRILWWDDPRRPGNPGPPPTLRPPHAARHPHPARCRLNPGGDRQSEQS